MIYLAITIDTECDKLADWSINYPMKFTAVKETIPNILQLVFDKYGAKPTYLLSPEIIADDKCVEVLKETLKMGAELGTHLHSEFIEPSSDFSTQKTEIIQNTLPPDIEQQKLRNLTNLFIEKFGYSPTSFRAGRFGLSKNTLNYLSELNYKVDSSVVPNFAWADKGGKIEFYNALHKPYFPSAEDFKKKGKLPILEVPVTVGNSWFDFLPKFILRKFDNYKLLKRVLFKFFRKKFQPVMLRPTFSSGTFENLKKVVNCNMKNAKNNDVFFVMMFHNVDFTPGCSPYCTSIDEQNNLINRLDKTLEYVSEIGGKFVTLNEIAKIYA